MKNNKGRFDFKGLPLKGLHPVFKIVLFLLLILTPLVALWAFFSPLVTQKEIENLKSYVLDYPVARRDVRIFIERMKEDPEFGFYFRILRAERAEAIEAKIYKILAHADSKDALMGFLRQQKSLVESLGTVFLHMQFDENLSRESPDKKALLELMWKFFEEEFILATVGLGYKANYDPYFSFHWDARDREAAGKFRIVYMHFYRPFDKLN